MFESALALVDPLVESESERNSSSPDKKNEETFIAQKNVDTRTYNPVPHA